MDSNWKDIYGNDCAWYQVCNCSYVTRVCHGKSSRAHTNTHTRMHSRTHTHEREGHAGRRDGASIAEGQYARHRVQLQHYKGGGTTTM